ncbi:MAG TPA: calcium-binding protein, partial [Sphingorhabdus sp.]|nr:calcium-binding protein [Sphingorhabdus sp.]
MKTKPFIIGLLAVSATSAALYAAPGMKADANGDKAISKSEAMAMADARFAKMDANGDGSLSQADKAAMVAKHFAAMDSDKNGSLSQAEFVAAHEARAEE